MPKFAARIDAMKLSIKGFVPESASSAPTSPVEGQGWHDTTGSGSWKAYLNGAWRLIVDARRSITAGTGLTGGGDLSADRTLSVDFAADGAATANKAVLATDSRLANSRTPSGTAGGDLTGTFPNPTVAALAITDAKVATANKDGAVGTPSMRTIGTGAQQAMAGNTRLNTIAAPTGAVDMSGQRITSVATPTGDSDAANKLYVDTAVQGIWWKQAVYLATTTNITLSGAMSIDGTAVANGVRVLVKNQTNGAENGIYVVNTSGAWARADDANTSAEMYSGVAVFVNAGTTQADTGWVMTTDAVVTLGTTALTWAQFTGVGTLVAGSGLTKTGNQVDIGAGTGIQVNADSIQINPSYVLPIAQGGTGQTTATAFIDAWNIADVQSNSLPALTAGTWTSTTVPFTGVAVFTILEASTNEEIVLDVRRDTTSGFYQVRSDVAWANAALTILIVGQP